MDADISNRSFFAISGAILLFVAGETLFFNTIRDLHNESKQLQEAIVGEITGVRERTLATSQQQAIELDALRGELATVTEQAAIEAGRAKADAQRHAAALAARLARQAQASKQQVAAELMNVRADAVAASAAIGDLNGEVQSARAEAAAARSGLDRTSTELSGAAAELSPMRDEIATNSRELAALRARGERRYFEFELGKSQWQEVAGVTIWLRKADSKRNRYTIEVFAAGRMIEEKDRGLNEPVRFYVARAAQPYELVVNRIAENRISGYLATPRMPEMARY
jgi:hypothetical protein